MKKEDNLQSHFRGRPDDSSCSHPPLSDPPLTGPFTFSYNFSGLGAPVADSSSSIASSSPKCKISLPSRTTPNCTLLGRSFSNCSSDHLSTDTDFETWKLAPLEYLALDPDAPANGDAPITPTLGVADTGPWRLDERKNSATLMSSAEAVKLCGTRISCEVTPVSMLRTRENAFRVREKRRMLRQDPFGLSACNSESAGFLSGLTVGTSLVSLSFMRLSTPFIDRNAPLSLAVPSSIRYVSIVCPLGISVLPFARMHDSQPLERSLSLAALDRCTIPTSPDDSRSCTIWVSVPKMRHLGNSCPTTAAVTSPECRPTRTLRLTSVSLDTTAAISRMQHASNAPRSAWSVHWWFRGPPATQM
mmetsp:Transcript_16298/g.41102  ORF Transcript_16298/g.41102 Transcript_16298/m.41102 type:complete len:360 (-) Transcript_16298:428-1507(-)